MKLHELKIDDKYFWEVALGKKTAEIRYNDREYQVGDILCLKNMQTLKGKSINTGLYVLVQITHIVTREEFKGLAKDYVMLSFVLLKQATDDSHSNHYYNSKEDEREEIGEKEPNWVKENERM